ncbi:lactonase family protein [Salmonirosea aquatica]|uniref:Beta-propeller fold lactonase family protein n=1 Tax=Salmonirosea aquatica TaxID=2654236 RepID=A0A7C9BTW6_9BACT|nr:beta-propeller fold lactonase family protein [Cytophagaceae bacterium SJW1-29]
MKLTLLILSIALAATAQAQPSTARFYVGTGTKGPESAITLCELNLKDGTMSIVDTFHSVQGPGYVSLSPDQKYLYSVNQDHTIAAFAVGKGGTLTYLDKQPAEGVNPCHVSVHPSGKMAFLANYTSGTWAAYPIAANGGVEAASATFTFTGSGPDKSRQEKPHAHCAMPSPNGKYVYISDLGTDRLMNYVVDAKSGKVSPNPAQNYFSTQPGAGPRHLTFHPSGRYLYLLNEMKATLTVCAVDANGVVKEIETVNTVPADFSGKNTAAAVHVHPNGKFVYASNRGYNAIHAYEIQKDGSLKSAGEAREGISTPRDFNFDPSGRYMVVGNQTTNDLVVYKVDPKTGGMTFLSKSISLKDPICFVFLK